MNNSNIPAKNQLNPFAFPSETDFRFLLLIVAIAGITLVLGDALVGAVVTTNRLLSFLTALGIALFVFIWAWYRAQRDAINIIKQRQWKAFPPPSSDDPYKEASLKRMEKYVGEIVKVTLGLAAGSPNFVWDDTSEDSDRPIGRAFGFHHQKYICLKEGLHAAFIDLPQSKTFDAVLLHELGHIANRDVNKITLSIALGKCFFPTAVVILLLLDTYLLSSTIHRAIEGHSLAPVWPGAKVIAEINFKSLLLILLVEIIRSSILRVREYYADARARAWLGTSKALIQIFSDPEQSTSTNSLKPTPKLQAIISLVWKTIEQQFRKKLAPLHPTHKKRIVALTDTRQLFNPNYEVAFFAGFLSGLALNASFILVTLLDVVGQGMQSLNQYVQTSQNALFILIVFVIVSAIFIVYLLGVVALWVGFGLVPIVGTIGLQIQAAAFADKVHPSQQRLISLAKLAKLSLVLGTGFVLGCTIVPVPKAFSLWGTPIPILPFYTVGWASVFFVWMLPLCWLASRVYARHTGNRVPNTKRHWLTVLSAIALLPSFIVMSVAQVSLGARILSPETVSIPNLEFLLLTAGVLAFGAQVFVWGVCWVIVSRLGWLRQSDRSSETPVSAWAKLPDPISLPPLPPQEEICMDVAPSL